MDFEYSKIETDFLEFSRSNLICFPVPETASGFTGHTSRYLPHNYINFEKISKLLGLGIYGPFNLSDYLSADVLEKIHETQCCLGSEMLQSLKMETEKNFEDIDGCIKKIAKKYGANIVSFGKALYNHPAKSDFEFLSRFPIACAVDVYRKILDDPNAVGWLDTDYNMGVYVIKTLDDNGIDSYDINHGAPKHYFNAWVEEDEKSTFSNRLNKIRKDLKEKDTRVKANTGGLDVATQPSDFVKKMSVYSDFSEQTKRPDRGKGGQNPLGGKVGFGKKAPRP